MVLLAHISIMPGCTYHAKERRKARRELVFRHLVYVFYGGSVMIDTRDGWHSWWRVAEARGDGGRCEVDDDEAFEMVQRPGWSVT